MRFIAKIDPNQLNLLINNNIGLLQFEKTGKWIYKNKSWLKFIYKRLPKQINMDEVIEEGRKHSMEVYSIFKQQKGRYWLEKQFQELQDFLT